MRGRTVILTMTLLTATACGPTPEEQSVPVAPDQVTTADGLYLLKLDAVPQPYVAGSDASLTVELLADGEAVDGALLNVKPWMPDHGHGISPGPEVTVQGAGRYEAAWVFSMPGYWELTLTVDADDGQDSAVVAYEVQ